MHRRTLVAGLTIGAVSSVAGCLDVQGQPQSIHLKPVDPATISDDAARSIDELAQSPLIRDLVPTLLDGETIELETTADFEILDYPSAADGSPSFTEGSFYYQNGETFYRIDQETLEEGRVTGPEYEVSRIDTLPDDVSADDEDEVLSFSDLPEYEQWRIHETFVFSDGRLIFFSDSVVVGYLELARQENSRLVDGIEQRYLEFNGNYIEIDEVGTNRSTVERVRVSATQVAADEVSFGDYIIEEYAVDAASMSTDVQELLKALRENDGTITATDEEEDEEFEQWEDALEDLESKRSEIEVPTERAYGTNEIRLRYDDRYYHLVWYTSIV